MGEILTKGWLPIDFNFDPEPAVITAGLVRWMEFGSAPLAEPFFIQTVAKLREASPPPMEVETRLDNLLRMSERLPPVRPAGFIFHVSHCGSTLVANALKSARGALVVSEAAPIVQLARLYTETGGLYLRTRWDHTRRTLLDSLFRLFAHYRTGEPERLVIKFASFNTLCMKLVRTYWPATPCVVIVRDPVEVLVSSVGEAGWMTLKAEPDRAREFFGLTDLPCPLEEMPGEEYCARVLKQHLASALESVDENCKVIDYEDLNPKRIRDIAEFFGMELPPDRQNLERVFGVYSKDAAHMLPYQDDRARKRRMASPAISSAARQWALPAYAELRGKGFW